MRRDPFIFNANIRENILLGNPDANMDEVAAASAHRRAGEFIGSLRQRYETLIGERGANLSGGQRRQRLAIARALVREPAILIFDEATSHLDTATELAIQKSLKQEFFGRTVVLVAHRLSTIVQADTIYVLNEGTVVEEGRHEELLRRGGWYAELWRSQSQVGETTPALAKSAS